MGPDMFIHFKIQITQYCNIGGICATWALVGTHVLHLGSCHLLRNATLTDRHQHDTQNMGYTDITDIQVFSIGASLQNTDRGKTDTMVAQTYLSRAYI